MINFFRKKRKKLANENRSLKYARYAIGEIVLVVIGILIAVQLNTWKENKKDLNLANSYLSTIKLNLEDDIKQAENLLSISQINIGYANIFLDQFKTLKPVNEKVQMYIVSLMLEYNIEVNKSGIDALNSSNGMSNINKSLQVKILDYYRHIEQLKSREDISSSDIKALYEPYVKENYSWIYNKTNPWPRQTEFYKNDPRLPTKIDEKSLLADKQLEIMVYGRRWQYINLNGLYTKTIKLAEEIISDIENSNTTTKHD